MVIDAATNSKRRNTAPDIAPSLKVLGRLAQQVVVLSERGDIAFASDAKEDPIAIPGEPYESSGWLDHVEGRFDNRAVHERALRRINGQDPFRWLTRVLSRARTSGRNEEWRSFLYVRCYLQSAPLRLVLPSKVKKGEAEFGNRSEWDLPMSVLPVLQGLDRVDLVCQAVAEVAAEATQAEYAAVRVGAAEPSSTRVAGPASAEDWVDDLLDRTRDTASQEGLYYPELNLIDPHHQDRIKGLSPLFHLSVPLVADQRFLGALDMAVPVERLRLAQCLEGCFVLASSLSVYLRWAPKRPSSTRKTQEKTLSIGVLGPMEVRVDGQPVLESTFRRKHSVELLKRLLATGSRSLNKEEVMDAFWPEASPKAAGDSLRAVMHSLRRGLEPELKAREASRFISADGERVTLNREQIRVDVDEFIDGYRQCTKLGRMGYIEEAIRMGLLVLDLYRGPFLEEEVYSDWCIAQRSRLHESFLDLTMRVGVMLMKRDDWETAIGVFHRAVVEEPAREDTHRALMIALWRSGRYSAALKQFDRCWNILRDSLGVSPSRETIQVREAILKSLEERRQRETQVLQLVSAAQL